MVTAEAFIGMVRIPLDFSWGYIYGTWGTLWTAKKQADSTREMTVLYGKKWIGHMVTDCSGLLRWALYQLGEEIVHHARYQYTNWCKNKGKLINGLREDGTPPLPGSAVFLQGKEAHIHHVGVYVGGDTVIEAKGTVYGVVTSRLNHWDHWGELKMVDYSDAARLETEMPQDAPEAPEDAEAGTVIQAVVNNPNTWLNVRSGPGTQYPVQFQVEKGTVVEVLDAGEPAWWQIRYGGRIGWASAQYLQPIKEPDTDSGTEGPDKPETDGDAEILVSEIGDCISDIYKNLEELTELVRQLGEAIR